LKKILFEISDEKYAELEKVAKAHGTSLQEAIEDGVDDLIREHYAIHTAKLPGLNKTLDIMLGPSNNIKSIQDVY